MEFDKGIDASGDPSWGYAMINESFEKVYRAHFPFVWRTALRLGANRNAVDDLVQETFLVVHRRLNDFNGRSQMTTWLFGIVRRVLSDHRRTLRRKPSSPTPTSELDRTHLHPQESARFEQLEAYQLVSVLLDTLDDDKREVFVMAEFEDMTMAEIAEATGVNPNTVSARLGAARRAFEEALRQHEGMGALEGTLASAVKWAVGGDPHSGGERPSAIVTRKK